MREKRSESYEKNILVTIAFVLLVTTLSSCGKSAVEKLNDNERKVYDALIAYADNSSSDPTSIKLFKCSDPFEGKPENFCGYDSSGMCYFHCSEADPNQDYVMVYLSTTNGYGGTTRDVYCMPINIDDRYYGEIWNYEHFYSQWDYESALSKRVRASMDGDEDTITRKELTHKLTCELRKSDALEEAVNVGCKLAESGSFPITEGKSVDISKVNEALYEHWKEIGLVK